MSTKVRSALVPAALAAASLLWVVPRAPVQGLRDRLHEIDLISTQIEISEVGLWQPETAVLWDTATTGGNDQVQFRIDVPSGVAVEAGDYAAANNVPMSTGEGETNTVSFTYQRDQTGAITSVDFLIENADGDQYTDAGYRMTGSYDPLVPTSVTAEELVPEAANKDRVRIYVTFQGVVTAFTMSDA